MRLSFQSTWLQEYPTEIEITLGENIKGEVARSEAVTDSILGYLGAHFLHKFFGEAGAPAMMATSHIGKTNDTNDEDDDSYYVDFGSDVDEDALIEQKSKFEKKFILKHRSLFSRTLSPTRYIWAPM